MYYITKQDFQVLTTMIRTYSQIDEIIIIIIIYYTFVNFFGAGNFKIILNVNN
jgi:hypothetical protein